MSFHKSFGSGGGTDISDATAEQWHIKNGKTAYIASGKVTGNAYTPAMMKFDGSTGHYSLTANIDVSAGFTFVCRFRWDGGLITSAGGFNRTIFNSAGATSTKASLLITNDQTSDSRAGRVGLVAQNNASSNICTAYGTDIVSDGGFHSVLGAYNPVTGAAVIKIDSNADQINASASGHTLITGSASTGSGAIDLGMRVYINDRFFNGNISYFGLAGRYITDWSLFFYPDGLPKPLDESTWTEWGGVQPILWHESAKMDENKGSAGNMTKNGGIILAPASSWS